jgi:hypothetical protein
MSDEEKMNARRAEVAKELFEIIKSIAPEHKRNMTEKRMMEVVLNRFTLARGFILSELKLPQEFGCLSLKLTPIKPLKASK